MKPSFVRGRLAFLLTALALGPLSSQAITFTTDTAIGFTNADFDGADIVVTNCVLTVDGSHAFASLQILNGGVLTHSFSTNGLLPNDTNPPMPAGLTLTISNDVLVARGGAIRTDFMGYGAGIGSGAGGSSTGLYPTGSGGGHGGNGGLGATNSTGGAAYGQLLQPSTLGSGGGSGYGGPGGNGGGLIMVTAGGALQIDGSISANGAAATNSRSGGGAGGSVWLTANLITGAGSISANGGAGHPSLGGGGGGGHIALQCGTNQFSGAMTAGGGGGFQTGGAGTIYVQTAALTNGLITVDNLQRSGAATPLSSLNNPDLLVSGKAIGYVVGSSYVGNLVVRSNSWLSTAPISSFNLTVTGNATIEAGSGIDETGRGYPSSQGPAPGTFALYNNVPTGGGGGHAGPGGSSSYVNFGGVPTPVQGGNQVNDSWSSPNAYGSGGGGNSLFPGGSGGGVIQLTVNGTLNLDGSISVDATGPALSGPGGGSGGSIWLRTGILAGTGRISANGGSAMPPFGGGGGSGGRIAIYYDTNQFAGTVLAQGGNGLWAGAAGTLYWKNSSDATAQVLLDNGGLLGATNNFSSSGPYDLTIQNGAVLTGSAYAFRNLTIRSNGSLWPFQGTPASTMISASGNVTIGAGGLLSLTGQGYPSVQGPGGGRYSGSGSTAGGGGGGYAGYGGNGYAGSYVAQGGNAYGYPAPGSGGGGYVPTALGGAGGGYLQLNVTGLLQVDGQVAVDGLPGLGAGAGGGSGGALYLTVGGLAGVGTISANGGAGDTPNGGGGGGGRISLTYSSNLFSGTLTANGGPGYRAGGAGTIYLKARTNAVGSVLLDNGGVLGTNTPLSSVASGLVDLTVSGGATATTVPNIAIRNVLVSSNSSLLMANNFGNVSETWSFSGNATIQPGGRISADGAGYNYNYRGNGSGSYYSSGYVTAGGGGGHAGYGGNGALGSLSRGGTAQPDPTQAAFPGGSGGTQYYTTLPDGAGGGALWLKVTGLLTVDGRLSADGMSSFYVGDGGGAGGGIELSVGGLAGAGVISACGGNGDLPNGGGGSGGCLAIYYQSNTFSGTMTVKRGLGYQNGGTGTIYIKQNNQNTGQLLVDGEGQQGTNTILWFPAGPSPLDVVVRGGASLTLSGAQTLHSLRLESNSIVLITNQALWLLSDSVIQAGAAIVADGAGYGPASGNGAGISAQIGAGGGSHGGKGGLNPKSTYDGFQAPNAFGSGGGNGSIGPTYAPFGGSGGGVIQLTVNGNLSLDGRLSAKGLPGGASSGGGAGGSISLNVWTLSGAGSILADGGAGNGTAGGGGGGRISVIYRTNLFTGSISAYGGGGVAPGGAGTIYTKAVTDPSGQLRIDNGGLLGANTPFTITSPLDLTVVGGAVANPSSSYLLLSNLVIGSAGMLSSLSPVSNLDVTILHDATIQPGGALAVDGAGFGLGSGPGAGLALSGFGSGAGYGGAGGDSATSPGGQSYGSVQSPTDLGSGGGGGSDLIPGGSQGGGALRLNVGGTLRVDGSLSANGESGVEDESGGGSGGSLFVTAGSFLGSGLIAANGGDGQPFGGGGGGGGRIALYSLSNNYQGVFTAAGGPGFMHGGTGTVYTAAYPANLQVLSQIPTGIVSNGVSQIRLTFSEALDPYSFTPDDVQLITPGGLLAQSSISISSSGSTAYQLSFPQQTAVGIYSLQIGPAIQDLFGLSMAQSYTGTFEISLPVLQGTITDTNGLPVAEVALAPSGPVTPGATDGSGSYTIGAPPATTFSVTPVKAGLYFIPSSRAYTNIMSSFTNENYLAVSSLMGNVAVSSQNTNLLLSCYGFTGVTYRVVASTDFVQWIPVSDWLAGTNGTLQFTIPVSTDPIKFFRIQAQD